MRKTKSLFPFTLKYWETCSKSHPLSGLQLSTKTDFLKHLQVLALKLFKRVQFFSQMKYYMAPQNVK